MGLPLITINNKAIKLTRKYKTHTLKIKEKRLVIYVFEKLRMIYKI